jgi:3-oxoacyl-[acyl-carrier protein] reductase
MIQIGFQEKIALITGGTRGLGEQVAEDLYSLGATVLITGTNQEQIDTLNAAEDNKEKRKYFFSVDFSDRGDVERFINELENFPVIDILVNNAGINNINYIDEALTEDWDAMLAVNLTAPFFLIREISRRMKKRSYGRIVNISSIFGKISKAKRAVYSATKFGIHGLTVGAANDLSKHNVLVNTVSPGFILTDLTRKNLSEAEIAAISEQIPIGRMAVVQDISSVVIFLVSEMNSYVTGQNIIADGGFVNV